MNRSNRMALLGSLAGLLTVAATTEWLQPIPGRRQGKVLRRRAEGQERLRRGRGHHLRRHLEGGLPGQFLEARAQGNLHDDEGARQSHGRTGSAAARPAEVLKTAECGSSTPLRRRPAHAGAARGRGVGLKAAHYAAALANPPPRLSRDPRGKLPASRRPGTSLPGLLRREYALSIHGVGLSLAAPRPTATELAARRALLDRYEADSFSEHLAWSGLPSTT